MNNGFFVISLDFELFWGVRDKRTIQQYGENIRNVHDVMPRLLNMFSQYQIAGTFSTVGMLFHENKEQLIAHIPSKLPGYSKKNLSPYNGHFSMVGNDFKSDPYHYAPQLIDNILENPAHEIGSHTYSHYYCLEDGQTVDEFRCDMEMAVKVANEKGIKITSLIFPRNQCNDEYLKVIHNLGFTCYRGTERSWMYAAKKRENETLLMRGLRLLDTYINISGHNCYSLSELKHQSPIDIPSSRFLRPFSKKLGFLDFLRIRRIKAGMTYAAKNNLIYHLWWHPHNFGNFQDQNFTFLEEILKHYDFLSKKYSFQSITMSNLSDKIISSI